MTRRQPCRPSRPSPRRSPSVGGKPDAGVGVLGCVRLLYGSGLLLAPGALLGHVPEARIDRRTRGFARVLGVRQIAQAAAVDRRRSRSWILAGVAVDAIHATTMAGLALLDSRRRVLAGANALAATAFALAGLHDARRV